MKVLIIAPQPFYQERGTPIAVRLATEALSRQLPLIDGQPCSIDLLVYNEGSEITIPGVNIIRAQTPRWLRGVRPGISCKKLLCDFFLFLKALQLLWVERNQPYTVIHAVEESVFFAWTAKRLFGIPYVYDMDSSLALQVTERWWWCRPALSLLQYFEGVAVRGSVAVAPVCDALQAIAKYHGSENTVILRDVSLLSPRSPSIDSRNRELLYDSSVSQEHIVILYVGNLESYQGIDLLLESFASIHRKHAQARLVIVGGTQQHILGYRAKAATLACDSAVLFIGPRPVHTLRHFLESADIVVSPRVKGNNTPMKIYSYLHSGTALLATDLPTHRQVLDDSIAMLVPPEPQAFADGLSRLISDHQLRESLGRHAQAVAEQLYTTEAFEHQINTLYAAVSQQINRTIAGSDTMFSNV